MTAAANPSPSRWGSSRRRLLSNRSFVIGAALVGTVIVLACLAGAIAPFDPLKGNFRDRMAPPSIEHWMGTDHFGRDILSRVLFGARSMPQADSATCTRGIEAWALWTSIEPAYGLPRAHRR